MTEIRCKKCKRLLMKMNGLLSVDIPRPGTHIEAEIKCPKCGYFCKVDILNKLQATRLGWPDEEMVAPITF